MKLRIMKIILLLPCAFIDGIALIFILLPTYIINGTNITTRQSLLEWLFKIKQSNQ
jgi:hypothetical protein